MMSVILVTLSILIVLFHPLIAIIVMLIYALLYMSNILPISISAVRSHIGNTWMVLAIMAIVFSIWSTYLYALTNVLDPLISSILGLEAGESQLMDQLASVKRVEAGALDLVKIGLLTYGLDVIFGLLALVCILYLLVLYIKKEITIPRFLLFSIVCFMAFFLLAVTIFFTINEFGYSRVYKIARIFSLLIISSSVIVGYRKLQNIRNLRKVAFCVLCCTSVVVVVLSVFTCHLSPAIIQMNQQVPEGDYSGLATFFEKRDDSIQILEYGASQLRFYDAIYGHSCPRVNVRYDSGDGGGLFPIDHFGYNASFSLGSNYDGRRYFLLTKQGRDFYENLYAEFPDEWRFMTQDFERLESDPSVILLYSNEGLDLYLINSFKNV